MALDPRDKQHAGQIAAGITGRNRGHAFEQSLAREIVTVKRPLPQPSLKENRHLVFGDPATELFRYVTESEGIKNAKVSNAFWLGGLATSGKGDRLTGPDGQPVTGSKSDILLELSLGGSKKRLGISVKTCFNKTPTNAQLFCTTAAAFCALLRANKISISDKAEKAMRMFCGDDGYRPMDMGATKQTGRLATPERWFWEELDAAARNELETVLGKRHAEVLTVLLQKAYPNDPFPPKYVMHVRHKADSPEEVPLAIYAVSELVGLAVKYQGFGTRPYQVRKGRFKNDPATHLAPRFGIVQFQPLGNTQNRNQLQFNLQASYFTKLPYDG